MKHAVVTWLRWSERNWGATISPIRTEDGKRLTTGQLTSVRTGWPRSARSSSGTTIIRETGLGTPTVPASLADHGLGSTPVLEGTSQVEERAPERLPAPPREETVRPDPAPSSGAPLADATVRKELMWPGHGDRVRIGQADFDNVDLAEAIARIDAMVERGTPSLVVTPNVDHLIRMEHDADYAALVAKADLVLADGQPILFASYLIRHPLKARVAGSDLFPALCAHAADKRYRVFFLGGDPGAADEARDVLVARHPELHVVGTHCPPYGFEQDPAQDAAAAEAVRSARPDILFVGLGSPKQERWIARHQDDLGVPVSIGVGVSFSFVSGQVKRAPVWMQRIGLEWMHRLLAEPGRLWRRYLLRGPAFLPIVAREMMRHRTTERDRTG